MSATQEQIASLEKKVGPASSAPLFARLAGLYLEGGRASDALKLCDKGLAQHPFYTTGHLVKGKALLALKMPAEARREFEIVRSYLPGNALVRKLIESVPPTPEEFPTAPPAVERKAEPKVTAPPMPAASEKSKAPAPPAAADPFGGIMGFTPSATPETAPVAPPPPPEPQEFTGFGVPAETTSDPFGLSGMSTETTVPPTETAPPEPVSQESADTSSGFDLPAVESPAFEGIPIPEPPVHAEPAVESAPSGANLFFGPGETTTGPPAGEESFDQFSTRVRGELTGENTISLEEFLGGTTDSSQPLPVFEPPPAAEEIPPPPPRDAISEIAEKLQTAKKITPVINLSERSVASASDQDTATSMGFVTPTLAEIYAKQGWYDDAIKAYKTLMANKPAERDRFEKRIAELEEIKKQQPPAS